MLTTVPIYLESYEHRIDDIRIDSALQGKSLDSAKLKASFEILPTITNAFNLFIRARLKDSKGSVIREDNLDAGVTKFEWTFDSEVIRAWWPIGYGDQPLYTVDLSLCRQVSLERVTLILGRYRCC
jgi:beta-mannosidase